MLSTTPVHEYPTVVIYYTAKRRKQIGVHILVCEAWHGPRPEGDYQVRHLNGDPTDSRVENLAWGTRADNTYDALRHGTHYHGSRTECPQGHPYTEENTIIRKNRVGGQARFCRACQSDWQRRWHEQNREEKNRREREKYAANREARCARQRELYRLKKEQEAA